jgi:hypothetical protein
MEALEVMECEQHFRQGSIGSKKKALATKLVLGNPKLQILVHDFNEIAKLQGISENEARTRFDFIQIQSNGSDTDIAIVIFDTIISVDISFKILEANHSAILLEVKSYLRIIMEETGYFVFDTECEKIYDYGMINNFEFDLKRRREKVKIAAGVVQSPRPWWKFWCS